jgi:hypothetical protein
VRVPAAMTGTGQVTPDEPEKRTQASEDAVEEMLEEEGDSAPVAEDVRVDESGRQVSEPPD